MPMAGKTRVLLLPGPEIYLRQGLIRESGAKLASE